MSSPKDMVNSLPGVYGLAQGFKNEVETAVAVTLDSTNEMLEKNVNGRGNWISSWHAA